MTPWPAAVLTAAAFLVLSVRPPGAARLARLSGGSPDSGPPPVAVAALLAAVTLGPLAAAAVAAGTWGARAAGRRAADGRATRANAAALPLLCRAAAAELRAGAPPVTALARAASDAPPAVAEYVRRLDAPPAPPPGAQRLAALAALWTVAAGAGAGLADGLDRLADALVAEQRQRAEVAAQLAGPRASAATLAALPAFGLLLAGSLGADPLGFFATPAGAACLTGAVALDAAGVAWIRRITTRAVA